MRDSYVSCKRIGLDGTKDYNRGIISTENGSYAWNFSSRLMKSIVYLLEQIIPKET